MTGRGWPIATLLFGLATLVIITAFSMLPDVRAAYPAGDFSVQLSAFQRATSMADLRALFGEPPDMAKLQAMTAGNSLDLYAFIPVYTLFLLCGAAMLAGGARARIAWFALVAALIGCAADFIETTSQLAISTDWPRAETVLPRVAPACWAKFFGLAAHAFGCSLICIGGERKRWMLGFLGVTPLLGVSADFLGVIHVPTLMSMTFGVFWIALLVVAALELFRKRA